MVYDPMSPFLFQKAKTQGLPTLQTPEKSTVKLPNTPVNVSAPALIVSVLPLLLGVSVNVAVTLVLLTPLPVTVAVLL